GAANAFRLYNKSGGQVLKGLINRREQRLPWAR
ncbi:glycoside hydrolase family protein, partial [Mycobacterium tuberculosis]